MSIKAILLMAGEGLRFGSLVPKQFHRLSGKRVYMHTLQRFIEVGLFDEIVLVCHPLWCERIIGEVAHLKGVRVVEGGKTRQISSYLGLVACGETTEYVVIHDAARPFVSKKILEDNVYAVMQWKVVDTCIPSNDTVVRTENGTVIEEIPERSKYWRGQTPQSFFYPWIMEAHKRTCVDGASDDCSLIQGHRIHIVLGDESNKKITTELDLFIAEQMLRLNVRSALGEEVSLAGKRFAVTGGTGGIGNAVCALLRDAGAEPLPIARRSLSHPCDLSVYENAEALFQRLGALDGLINCVGLLKRKEIRSLSMEEIEAQIAVNLSAPIFACRLASIKNGGHIINVASSSYSLGRKECALYSSAKAALVNFTQALADECPAWRVNVVIPGRTHTLMRTNEFPDESTEDLLDPKEVAKRIVDLLKQKSITGQMIEIRSHYTQNNSKVGI